jgi:hypothetical protein
MKWNIVLCLSFVMGRSCLATTQAPYASQCRLLDQVLSTIGSPSQTSSIALELLEQVALGRTSAISSGAEAQVGVPTGEFQKQEYNAPEVHACAFRAIGETDLQEAVNFLKNLKRADIGADTTEQIWPAVQDALANALLSQIADPRLKLEFLERTVRDREPAAHWAREQLCNSGALSSMPVVEKSIRQSWSGQYGEDEVRFCEARMQVVSRHPDRSKALGSVLSVENFIDDDRLIRWAMYELMSLRTPNANAELKRFATEIGRLPNGSAHQQRLSGFRQEIDHRVESPRQNRGAKQ